MPEDIGFVVNPDIRPAAKNSSQGSFIAFNTVTRRTQEYPAIKNQRIIIVDITHGGINNRALSLVCQIICL